jgi:hypothetical protein
VHYYLLVFKFIGAPLCLISCAIILFQRQRVKFAERTRPTWRLLLGFIAGIPVIFGLLVVLHRVSRHMGYRDDEAGDAIVLWFVASCALISLSVPSIIWRMMEPEGGNGGVSNVRRRLAIAVARIGVPVALIGLAIYFQGSWVPPVERGFAAVFGPVFEVVGVILGILLFLASWAFVLGLVWLVIWGLFIGPSNERPSWGENQRQVLDKQWPQRQDRWQNRM